MKKKKSHYRFDLKNLEDQALAAYADWEKKDDQHTRAKFFEKVRQLAYAVVAIGPARRLNVDPSVIAFEYALYFFERVMVKGFRLKARDRFPLQHYIRKNVLHVLHTHKNNESSFHSSVDMKIFIDEHDVSDDEIDQETVYAAPVLSKQFGDKLFKSLSMFYEPDTIKRMIPMVLEILRDNPYPEPDKLPVDLSDFCITFMALSKRLTSEDRFEASFNIKRKDLPRAFAVAVRSTVFLATLANTRIFPKSLLLSLDLESLYRLCAVAGGQILRVPTQKELETLIGSAVALSNNAISGKQDKQGTRKVRQQYDLAFAAGVSLNQVIDRVSIAFDLFKGQKQSKPLIDVLFLAVSSMEEMLGKLSEDDSLNTSESLKQYVALSEAFSNVSRMLMAISDKSNKNSKVMTDELE